MRRRKTWLAFSSPSYTREDKAAAVKMLRPEDGDPQAIVRKFEAAIAARMGVPPEWVVCTNSATAAICTAHRVLCGKRHVVAPVLTWPSTYSTCDSYDLVDVGPDGLIQEPADRNDRAYFYTMIPVDLWGKPAKWHGGGSGLQDILDAAQNLFDPRHVSMLGCGQVRAVVYSFGPIKQISCVRGGCLVARLSATDRANVLQFIDSGTVGREGVESNGFNFEMGEFNAALGLSQLQRFDLCQEHRQLILAMYRGELQGMVIHGGSGHLAVLEPATELQSYKIRAALYGARVHAGHHYPLPRHVPHGNYPIAASLSRRVLTLPCHCCMTLNDAEYVARVVRAAL